MTLDEAVDLLRLFGPNCLLGICCPPKEQRETLTAAFVGECGLDEDTARGVATWVLAHFDLAPKDQLTPLLRKAGELALGG